MKTKIKFPKRYYKDLGVERLPRKTKKAIKRYINSMVVLNSAISRMDSVIGQSASN